MITQNINPSAKVISSLLQHKHTLSVYIKEMPFSLTAKVMDLELITGRITFEIEYPAVDIQEYLSSNGISFDLEALKGAHHTERDIYNLNNVPCILVKINRMQYQLECQLPESVFIQENRGAIRIPFIFGMRGRVSIEVYPHELKVTGSLHNLSVGGCMIDVDLSDCVALGINQTLPGITLEFPNGETFWAEGKIRHIRPFGNHGYAAIGIQFINLSSSQTEALYHYVNESEREAIYRTGSSDKVDHPSPLFIPGVKEKMILQYEIQEREKLTRRLPAEKAVMNIAHQLQIGLIYIKNHNLFPIKIFYSSVDILLNLVKEDRKNFLYALAFLRDESDWVRHAIVVAGQLADILFLRDPYNDQIREAVLGTLLHTMGKALLISVNLPSLKVDMTPPQKNILKGHVIALSEKLKELGWEPSPVCRDVIENANERLDGAGYPNGKRHFELSYLIRLVSVIKAVNKLIYARNGIPPRTPLEAYRYINEAENAYDKAVLMEYIRTYGKNPIGTLVKYSGGFLAWVMDVNDKGEPIKVNITKNLRFPESNINSILSKSDLLQIGKLEGVVNPTDYGVKVGFIE
ncbi:metal-dependent phosphohydrolase [Brenneria izadpanahii]|uniref:Metal-dependent phosphohydrolase n=1 Tax=Brenneria izadpanahii TaxID=2722756 RepID=A0ABX7UWP8_9GAMM|nr:PilZ domain-containing protein [Brenneria izadpanahii]QTF08585.1 metal-dependent phosphohydrolase [Brenneria izadpanahii]